MTETSKFDAEEYLDTPERMAAYMKEQDAYIMKLRAALEGIDSLATRHVRGAMGMAQWLARKALNDI